MGSSGVCWLGAYSVAESRNDIDPGIMRLFRSSDKVILSGSAKNIPSILKHYAESWEEDPELVIVFYSAPAKVIRDRLSLLGYTLESCKRVFEIGIEAKIKRLEDYLKKDSYTFLRDVYRKEIAILSTLTFDSWQDNLSKILYLGLEQDNDAFREGTYKDTELGYMLTEVGFGYPGPDQQARLRMATEAVPEDTQLLYDLTDLVWSEYFESNEDFVELASLYVSSDFSSQSRIVVLTEGRSDARILSESIDFLYPHLRDYFSFMDFESLRIGGGTGNLVNWVKAFAGAGIANRTIALFDNDTAAESALYGLSKMSLPANIRVLKLPELDFLRDYPTIGPTGYAKMNINSLAGSLELYLGADALKDESGDLTPIQWTGYDSGLKRYQGEVLNKSNIQARFFERIKEVKSGSRPLDEDEWQDLKSVLHALFTAFNELDAQDLESAIRHHYS